MEPTTVSQDRACIMSLVPKFSLRPLLPLDTPSVQLWDGQRNFVAHVLIEYTQEDDRKRCECKVDKQNICIVKKIGDVEIVVNLVPEQRERPDNVLDHRESEPRQVFWGRVQTYLIKEVRYGFCYASIGPSAMD